MLGQSGTAVAYRFFFGHGPEYFLNGQKKN